MAPILSASSAAAEIEDAEECFLASDGGAPSPAAPELPEVEGVCCLSPVCDFLLWALYRQDRFDLQPPELPGDPVTDRYGHFPQFAAAHDVGDPATALALLPAYEREELSGYDLPADELRARLEAALPSYPEFLAHWEDLVKPLEEGLLDGWRDHMRQSEPLSLFQRLTRRPLGHDRLHLFACYYHPSGSALTPYPYLFTTLFNRFSLEPTLPWFVGHEATHLLLDESRWWMTAAGRRGLARYGSRYDAEEPLCLLVQNRLSSICGLLPEEEMQQLDAAAAPNIPLYLWLQARWEEYLDGPEQYPTLVEFFLEGLQRAPEGNGPWERMYSSTASKRRGGACSSTGARRPRATSATRLRSTARRGRVRHSSP
jgi:hypothetical protein